MSTRSLLQKALACAALATTGLAAQATTIDFEGTGAPSVFAATTPLTTLYSGLGVTFAGVGGAGGSIVNQDGNFGFSAHSGTDFLAFNTAVGTGTNERISFATAVSWVSIWAASRNSGSFSLEAFDANDLFMGSVSVLASTTWQQLGLGMSGIKSVSLNGFSGSFAYDDLQFTAVPAVPEPETYAMLLAGLGVLGFIGKRRRAS